MKLVRTAILALAACTLQGCTDDGGAPVDEHELGRNEPLRTRDTVGEVRRDERTPAGLEADDLRPTQQDRIQAAVASEHRSEEARERDQDRHPVETLDFFDIEHDMTVVELWPGTGWYTEILAPLLAEEGKLIAASFGENAKPEYRAKIHEEFINKVEGNPEVFGEVEVVTFNPPDEMQLGEPGSADMVLTFRNTHNWINAGVEEDVYRAAFEVLRPGGTFGVVQHRGQAGGDLKEIAKRGYVPEPHVKQLAENVGFELAQSSEVNANPLDTKDYQEGVWTLPPTYRLGDKDRQRYEAIGESDRMTLQFRKPMR